PTRATSSRWTFTILGLVSPEPITVRRRGTPSTLGPALLLYARRLVRAVPDGRHALLQRGQNGEGHGRARAGLALHARADRRRRLFHRRHLRHRQQREGPTCPCAPPAGQPGKGGGPAAGIRGSNLTVH